MSNAPTLESPVDPTSAIFSMHLARDLLLAAHERAHDFHAVALARAASRELVRVVLLLNPEVIARAELRDVMRQLDSAIASFDDEPLLDRHDFDSIIWGLRIDLDGVIVAQPSGATQFNGTLAAAGSPLHA